MPTVAAELEVVVARAVIQREGRTLLVRRAARDSLGGFWELPGGKVDCGELAEDAVLRELAEETELVAAGAPSLSFEQRMTSPSGRRVLERVYSVRVRGVPSLSAEHDGWIWQSPDENTPGPLTSSAAHVLAASGYPAMRTPT